MELFQSHLQNAKLFFEYLKYSGLCYSYDEISDSISYENYQMLLKEIETFDRIPLQDNYVYASPSTVFDSSMYIIEYLFGSVVNQNFIDDLSNRILIRGKSNVYEGALVYEDNPQNKKFLFDRLDTTTSIPVFTHEVTHFLYDETPIFSNIHTLDILAILSELIAVDIIDERKIDDISKKAIYVARIKDLKDTYEILSVHYPQYKNQAIDRFALNLIKLFATHTTYKYTYSFMVAYNLFLCYKEDQTRFKDELKKLVENKEHISTLLNYYNIGFKNNKSTDNAIKLIKSL